MKSLLKIILFFLFMVHAAGAADEKAPDRKETIQYINNLLKRLNDTKVGYVTLTFPNIGTNTYDRIMGTESEPLLYNASDGSYTFSRSTRTGPVEKVGNYRNVWFTRRSTNRSIPIKSIKRFSRNTDSNETYRPAPGVGGFCLHFDIPVLVIYENSALGETQRSEENESTICFIYPNEDPNNFTRLQNAFLRLKEIESEVRDPFLD